MCVAHVQVINTGREPHTSLGQRRQKAVGIGVSDLLHSVIRLEPEPARMPPNQNLNPLI